MESSKNHILYYHHKGKARFANLQFPAFDKLAPPSLVSLSVHTLPFLSIVRPLVKIGICGLHRRGKITPALPNSLRIVGDTGICDNPLGKSSTGAEISYPVEMATHKPYDVILSDHPVKLNPKHGHICFVVPLARHIGG